MLDRPAHAPSAFRHASPVPLLLVPGTLCDGREFAPTVADLACETLIVPLSGASSIPDMARLLLAKAPPVFALCGFSLGAGVALEVVAQAPHRVERLALIAGMAGTLPPEAGALRRATVARLAAGDASGLLDRLWPNAVAQAHQADASLRATLLAMAEAMPVESYREQIEMSLNRRDLRSTLSAIAVPTTVICGAEDRACPPELSAAIAAAIPGARLAIIEDAGHFVTLEQPRRVADELARWLAEPPNSRHPLPKEAP